VNCVDFDGEASLILFSGPYFESEDGVGGVDGPELPTERTTLFR